MDQNYRPTRRRKATTRKDKFNTKYNEDSYTKMKKYRIHFRVVS